MQENLKKYLIRLRSNSVESGPPLSTILGNFGANTIKFCKDFNEYTKDLSSYFMLPTIILITLDRNCLFTIKIPNISFFIKLFIIDHTILIKGSGGFRSDIVKVIKLSNIYLIAKLKFGVINLKILKQLFGTLSSMQLYVIK